MIYCPQCDGKGECEYGSSGTRMTEIHECQQCGGSGQIPDPDSQEENSEYGYDPEA